jgi:carbonic anhydrase
LPSRWPNLGLSCAAVKIGRVTEGFLENNRRYAESFNRRLPRRPSAGVAVVACMDARLDVFAILGLKPGEANVIRNAGGVVTEHEIRSLAISQRVLGTREIIIIRHTDCGMMTFTDEWFKRHLEEATGIRPTWPAEVFTNLEDDVRASIRRVRSSPFIARTDSVRGFVLDVATGKLGEVR